jgi:16S rRNA processing protein RimM
VRVESFTDPPESLLRYREWQLSLGEMPRTAWKVAAGRVHGQGLIASFEGLCDCDAAARLRGARIEVARALMPATRRREHYQVDLIGLVVTNEAGIKLGTVREFVDSPGGTVMVVSGKLNYWIPAVPEYLLKVELEAGVVRVRWPEADEPDFDGHG